jgi:hypothetical protein
MADFRASAKIQIPQIPTPSVKSVKSVIFSLPDFLPVVCGRAYTRVRERSQKI